jgi:excisionase family DNA binding protein
VSEELPHGAAHILGEPLVDAAAVAEFLGVDKTTIYRMAATAALPAIEIAPRVLRFRPEDVRAFVEARTRKASPRGRVKQLLHRDLRSASCGAQKERRT